MEKDNKRWWNFKHLSITILNIYLMSHHFLLLLYFMYCAFITLGRIPKMCGSIVIQSSRSGIALTLVQVYEILYHITWRFFCVNVSLFSPLSGWCRASISTKSCQAARDNLGPIYYKPWEFWKRIQKPKA